MFFNILNKLNKTKKFPYYFLSPLPYAIGNASKQILIASSKAKELKKKLIILDFKFFSKILKYKVCNSSLFNDLVIDKFSQKKVKALKFFFIFFLEIEFLFRRGFVLINDIFFKFRIDEIYRFPNIGFPDIYETKKINTKNIHLKRFNDIKQFNLNHNLVDLENKIKNECEKKLNNLKINKSDKIVCLHVREGSYRKDHNRRSYRNSNINN